VFVTVGVESLLQWRMLALDDAALARLMIAATGVSPKKRSRWLRELAAKLDGPARTPAAARQAKVAPIRLLLSSIIQPKCRHLGSRLSRHVSISVILVSAGFRPKVSLGFPEALGDEIFDYRRCVLPSANGDRGHMS